MDPEGLSGAQEEVSKGQGELVEREREVEAVPG
jgi:hypothetical protein